MASTFTPIQTTTLSTATRSVTFSSIPATYTDLVVVASITGISASGGTIVLRMNGDTAANYSTTSLSGTGSATSSSRYTRADALQGVVVGGANYGAATGPQNIIAHVMNYANSTTNKTVIARHSDPGSLVQANGGIWNSTSAVTSITIDANLYWTFSTGSTFTLWGILNA